MDQSNQDNTDMYSKIPDDVKIFLESILMDAGMTTLDAQGKDDMIRELYTRLDSYLVNTIVDNMPEDALDEFTKINETSKDREEIEKFIKEKVPNSEEIFARAFLEFRDLYLGNVELVKHAPSQEEKQSGGS